MKLAKMDIPRETIALREFSYEARRGLENISQSYDLYFPDLENQYGPNTWAGLFFILREVPDTPDFFPKGKWATIQYLEGMLIQWAKDQLSFPPAT
jgi:hypothetical protein